VSDSKAVNALTIQQQSTKKAGFCQVATAKAFNGTG